MSDEHDKAIAVIHEAPVAVMHPMVQMAMSQGGQLDTDTLRELMQLQREFQADESKRAFTAAMVELKADLPAVIAKDGVVDFTSSKGRTHYRHATLAGAMAEVEGPLTRHGFSLGWKTSQEGGRVRVVCELTHKLGHSESTALEGPVDTSGGKNGVQGIASTVTYLSRYTALTLLGLATGDIKEPPPPDGGGEPVIDVARNRKALAALKRRGQSREAAEHFAGVGVDDWTTDDLARLRDWSDGHATPAAGKICGFITRAASEAELDAIWKNLAEYNPTDADMVEIKAAYGARLAEVSGG